MYLPGKPYNHAIYTSSYYEAGYCDILLVSLFSFLTRNGIDICYGYIHGCFVSKQYCNNRSLLWRIHLSKQVFKQNKFLECIWITHTHTHTLQRLSPEKSIKSQSYKSNYHTLNKIHDIVLTVKWMYIFGLEHTTGILNATVTCGSE